MTNKENSSFRDLYTETKKRFPNKNARIVLLDLLRFSLTAAQCYAFLAEISLFIKQGKKFDSTKEETWALEYLKLMKEIIHDKEDLIAVMSIPENKYHSRMVPIVNGDIFRKRLAHFKTIEILRFVGGEISALQYYLENDLK